MSEQDWKARAEREAAAILAGLGYRTAEPQTYTWLVSLAAAAWLQGANYADHVKLSAIEMAFERVQAEL